MVSFSCYQQTIHVNRVTLKSFDVKISLSNIHQMFSIYKSDLTNKTCISPKHLLQRRSGVTTSRATLNMASIHEKFQHTQLKFNIFVWSLYENQASDAIFDLMT